MYKYYLSIGSNIGNISKNLDKAINILKLNREISVLKIAPYYFTKPLLPNNADESFYKMYCNTCIEIMTNIEPIQLLFFIKQIENKMGRNINCKFWEPRIIDIDILYCKKNNQIVKINIEDVNQQKECLPIKNLIIPHREIFNRSFVLDPLSYLDSNLKINGKNILKESKKRKAHQSVIMGIVNLTNNSFSGDGVLDKKKIEKKIISLVRKSIPIIDIGCVATNKNSYHIDINEEVNRLKNVFNIIKKIKNKTYSTKFSIDTYNPKVAKLAIDNGFEIINDVNGFKDIEMWKIMQENKNIECIIMHSITPHSSNNIVLDRDIDIINEINNWIKEIKFLAAKYNVNSNRIIIDYGIGFGKTSFQSIKILQNLDKINNQNFRVLIGHSKKSFMSLFTDASVKNRTFETIGSSLILQQKGTDVIRVHDAIELQKAIIGYLNMI